ncbi:cytochrome P450 [Peniophora sp. CONT]|nr:cytochrome P450 [Peniophora sp. CONT]
MALVTVCCCALFVWVVANQRPRRVPLPPSPTPSWIPLVGNALQIPATQPWLKFAEWAKELGPIYMINMYGAKIMVLNTVEVAQDLLDERFKNYSERPRQVMVCELMGWKFDFALLNFTDPIYHTFRRLFVREFSSHAMNAYRGTISHETRMCLNRLLEDPANFEKHLYDQVVGSNMAIAYGYPNARSDDEHVLAADKAQASVIHAMRPGNFWLVDVFPILKYVPAWVPGAGFKRIAREGREVADNMRFGVLRWSLKQYEEGKTQPSFFTRLMESYQNEEISLDIVRDGCATFHSVASDTTMSALLMFLLAMLYAPEAQKRAQQELDSVTGGHRLPEFSDRTSLPYIDALVKEVLRWQSVVPLGLAHVTRADDVYNGMFIPAGTVILPNQYAMSHDESIYPEPDRFIPERFLGADKQRDPDTIAFGFGARLCPGRHLAQLILWLDFACILSCFTIERPKDSDGHEYLPSLDFTNGLTSRPESLQCRFVPRHSR